MNTVLLVTNKEDVVNTLSKNLVLLRASDAVQTCTYEDAPDVVYDKRPDIVIVHENEERSKTINIIKYLKEKRIFDNTNIILLIDCYDRDFILSAYDEGIDDYFTINSDPSEMLIRVINCIKKSEQNKSVKNLKYYLSSYGIISGQSGFYSAKFAQEIFELELINSNFTDGVFMIVTPDEEGKKVFSENKMTHAITESVRSCDVIAEASGSKYYMLLNTDVNGALVILNKIKSLLPENLTVKAGIAEICSRKFTEVEKHAVCALNEAFLNNTDYIVYLNHENVTENWFADEQNEEKSYKFFKGVFNKKLEKVIAPVFYRLQKIYEDRFVNTKIEQFTDEKQSVFRLITSRNESRLKIVYPGFSKVIVYIVHSGLDSPENREITLPINMITQKEISDIVEDFIKEFVLYTSKEKI